MSSNIVNQTAYLRTSRQFPEEMHELCVEINKTYVDIANSVNSRIIGIFPKNRPAVTGEGWFLINQRQESLRQVFTFTSTAPIPHLLTFDQVPYITRMWGQYTDGTNWYGLIPASNTSIAGQVSFYLSPKNITFLSGAGAPVVTKGIVIIERMSNI